MARFHGALREHRDELNSLNVYPVPDGDTGTNMLLTQEAVHDAVAARDGVALDELGRTVAQASLMGARGNSGVILSQVLRGLCEVLCGEGHPPSAADLAEALARAAGEARSAVAQPAEGTVLTVLADAAEAAGSALRAGGDLAEVARAAHEAGHASVDRTREILPALRDAGVVDAGGKGIVLLLDAIESVLAGREMTEEVGPLGPVGHAEPDGVRERPEFAFEVQYLLEAEEAGVRVLRERLLPLGDSLVIVGGGGTFKVHVHTNEPGEAIEEALGVGRPRQIRVADLSSRVAEHCIAGQARAVAVAEQATSAVAVADGEGLARIFRSLGVVVVPGGPGRNPPVSDLVEAIEAVPARSVILLPNHRNVVPAARQAAEASRKDVRVVATRSVPEGVCAAAAFTPTSSPDENERAMAAATRAAAAGEVVAAVREADTGAGRVREGDLLGVSDGEVLVVGDDPVAVAADLARELRVDDHELLTLFVGAEPSDEEAGCVADALRAALDGVEVEVHRGGQPSRYLLGLE
ncbi:MAG: DAK2 domain-containing protein [Actinobacteria bacterium]|nr:DAK2 domain-containing protein [Actinomycetota bacterium]